MKITILTIGKKHDPKLTAAIEDYSKRLNHYTKFAWQLVDAKITPSMSPDQIRNIESDVLLNKISEHEKLILLDETGKQLSSIENAENLQKYMNQGTNQLIFVIGGAYGVNDAVKDRADFIWSLSDLVFPHQLVRLILAEQLYRGHTILAGEKYHHI
jgi:23S rRNA (pseudouridine1915-N3)-methyltransferase